MKNKPVIRETTVAWWCMYCNGVGYLGKVAPVPPEKQRGYSRIYSLIKCSECSGTGKAGPSA